MPTSPNPSQSALPNRIFYDAPQYSSYRPLDANRREIRLLDVINESEYCISHANLDLEPSYRALSYYWDPPGATKPISVNSEVVPIRKTLFQFLKSLYRQVGRLTVWLDAICIEQRVIEEQSAQVAMMGEIYRQAQCVYCWLGKGDPDTDYAMIVLGSCDSLTLADEGTLRMVEPGVEQMFLRRYWTRVWVVHPKLSDTLPRAAFVICFTNSTASSRYEKKFRTSSRGLVGLTDASL